MRLQDVLGDQVLSVRPELLEPVPVGILKRRDVVDQGVEPDVRHVVFVERQGDAPVQPGARPRDAQVVQRILEQGERFVLVPLGTYEIRVLMDVIHQPQLVFAHTEEVVFLFPRFRSDLVLRAKAVFQFPFRVEAFAPGAVHPLVTPEVDVPRIVDLLKDVLNDFNVIRIGRADEVAVFAVQVRPQVPEGLADDVRVFLWPHASVRRRLEDLIPVLVRPGDEKGFLAVHMMKPVHDVGYDGGVCVSQVGFCVDIVYRRRYEESLFHYFP